MMSFYGLFSQHCTSSRIIAIRYKLLLPNPRHKWLASATCLTTGMNANSLFTKVSFPRRCIPMGWGNAGPRSLSCRASRILHRKLRRSCDCTTRHPSSQSRRCSVDKPGTGQEWLRPSLMNKQTWNGTRVVKIQVHGLCKVVFRYNLLPDVN